jgi:hypothetical protein
VFGIGDENGGYVEYVPPPGGKCRNEIALAMMKIWMFVSITWSVVA